MDPVLTKARADAAALSVRCANLEDELKNAQSELNKLTAFIEVYEKYAVGEKYLPHHGYRSKEPEKVASFKKRGLRPGSNGAAMVDASIGALKAAGKPLQITELLDAVRASGVTVTGVRPATNLSSALSRSPEVRYEHPIGWRLTLTDPSPQQIGEATVSDIESGDEVSTK